jgi:hypothetical protein
MKTLTTDPTTGDTSGKPGAGADADSKQYKPSEYQDREQSSSGLWLKRLGASCILRFRRLNVVIRKTQDRRSLAASNCRAYAESVCRSGARAAAASASSASACGSPSRPGVRNLAVSAAVPGGNARWFGVPKLACALCGDSSQPLWLSKLASPDDRGIHMILIIECMDPADSSR